MIVGDLNRKLIGVRVGAAVDITDMADAARTEPRHDQHLA